ncbi:sulfatase-like hydrolase/transferase [Gemmata obscuriglobus]|uniref:Sulfatase N-terminal domain-containing protein n=1 Tax=Gemmata obscuriglobus TaxID=114 RepID=A0A2Z3GRX6_9BACT|nr:sulfatase-like hydrolase/transferase [Gemmata obscuriglobus]AWM36523.1 hypothetical protein C1280_05465 [Gemmata obscuriglobus]VTS10183.1 sulfatase : Arylsulfatase A family protein OS=Singulisphaera acidiphila (strain ATCC BAA-1392 / DSM 18658 / VKM B-2454 / MOB10) GN=Sinac_7268 PE=4 SV=1: Sulfatase [Gemmata obscuriglobus UQM 2246]
MRVIVFALNGLPAGWLGAYGNDWVGTPHLDRFAAEGVTFDRHISDRPDPDAARRAWTGKHFSPTESEQTRGPATETPLLVLGERAGESGSSPRTVLVRANHPDTDAPDWFYAGWQEVFDARPKPDDDSPLEELIRSLPALLERLRNVPEFLLWIETDRLLPPWDVQQDVFEAYLEDIEEEPGPKSQTADGDEPESDEAEETDEVEELESDEADESEGAEEAHEPEEPTPALPETEEPEEPVEPFADPPTGPFDRADLDLWDWLHKTFAAVVTKLDAELGAVFEILREEELDRSAAWLITSDFGHPLGEHGQVGLYRPWLHEELVHLPLLLRLPNAEQAGRRVSGFTQPPDLFPTLLELFGLTPPAGTPGHSLLPPARGLSESLRASAITQLELGGAAEIALRTGEWSLIVPTLVPEGDPPREPQLYEKPDDRWEVNDLRVRNIERADELEALLREEIQKAKQQPPGDAG